MQPLITPHAQILRLISELTALHKQSQDAKLVLMADGYHYVEPSFIAPPASIAKAPCPPSPPPPPSRKPLPSPPGTTGTGWPTPAVLVAYSLGLMSGGIATAIIFLSL